jgi:hypothetical protein
MYSFTEKKNIYINVIISAFCYVFILLAIIALFNKYSFLLITLCIIFTVTIYVINLDLSISAFIYLALIPTIQHFGIFNIPFGDFIITPHMIIEFIIVLFILSDFLLNNYPINIRKFNIIDKLLILFILFSFFSLIFPYYLPVNHTKRWLLFYTGIFETSAFYFIITYLIYKNDNNIYKILIALLCSSFSSLFIAILEFRDIGFNLIDIYFARMRIGFGYHNTNLFGIHSVVLFPIIFYLLIEKNYKKTRIISWFSLIILMVLSILCFNRGTFVVIIFQTFLLFLIKENRKTIYAISLGFISIVIYFSNIIIFYVYRFIGSAEIPNNPLLDKSALYRLEAWETGLQTLFLYPLGVGAGGFQYVWEKYGSTPSIYLGTPHHLFLSIGVDYGIIPMILFMCILIISYLYCSKLVKHDSQPLFRYIKISIIGFVLYGLLTDGELSHLTGFVIPNNGYNIYLFSLLAIISSRISKSQDVKV